LLPPSIQASACSLSSTCLSHRARPALAGPLVDGLTSGGAGGFICAEPFTAPCAEPLALARGCPDGACRVLGLAPLGPAVLFGARAGGAAGGLCTAPAAVRQLPLPERPRVDVRMRGCSPGAAAASTAAIDPAPAPAVLPALPAKGPAKGAAPGRSELLLTDANCMGVGKPLLQRLL
jgi:hypothetical protein